MGLYRDRVLPHVIDAVCGSESTAEQRAKVVPLVSGRVLEVGMGSGRNLPFYDRDSVEAVWGIEPSDGMRRKAADAVEAAAAQGLRVELLDAGCEEIPLDDDSIDAVVFTYTLCSIDDWRAALGEVRRVLRPGGRLVFSEHGLAPDAPVAMWQHRLNPVWKRVAGGCNLDRPITDCFEEAGFRLVATHAEYRGAPKFATHTFWGVAESPALDG